MNLIDLKLLVEKPISGEWGKEGDKVNIIRTTNFTNEGVLNLKNVVKRDIDEKKINIKRLQKGDIVIEKSGGSPKQPVGRVVFYDLESEDVYLCNNFTSILRPKKDKVNPKYLHYILFVNHKKGVTNKFQNKTTGIINLKLNNYLNDLKIPLPKLEKQKKIAAILDEADKVRQLNKELIAKYGALTQSLFLEMFGDPVTNPKGWEKVKFNTICSFEKTSIKPENIISGTFYIGLESIEKETGKILDKVSVIENELKSNKFYFDENFILYGKLRPYLNKVGNPDFEGICSTDIIPLKPFLGKSNKQFVTAVMRSSGFVSWANERCSGANLPRISPKEVEKYLIINPPVELQNKFAERVQIIKNQKRQAQESLQKSEDLFNSLLQKAFKGELVK